MGTWEFPGPGGVMLRGTGDTPQDAAINAVNTYNQQATAVAAPAPGARTPKAPDIVGRIKQALVGSMSPAERGAALQGDIREPSATGEALRGAGEAVLPGSIEELVIQMASGGAGRVATAASGGMKTAGKIATRVGTEVGLPAAAGATAGALTSGDPTTGAATGATAGGITGLLAAPGSAVGAWMKRARSLNDVGQQRSIRNVLGPQLATSIVEDIPALRGKVRNLPDVQLLRTEEGGRKVLGGMFDAVEAQIAATTQTVPLPATAVIAAGKPNLVTARMPAPESQRFAEATAAAMNTTVDDPRVMRVLEAERMPTVLAETVTVPAKTAIEIAKTLRHQSMKKGEMLPGHQPRVLAEQVQEAISNAVPEALAQRYAGLRQDYSKFMRLRDLLDKGGADFFPRMTEGGATIDLVKFHRGLIDNLDSVTPQEFPALHRFFTGGEPLGTGPTTKKGQHVGVHVPGLPVYMGVGTRDKVQLPAAMKQAVQPTSRVPGAVGGVGRAAGVATVPTVREEMR